MAHADRSRSRHRRLHEPRAGARKGGRQAHRHLGVRLRALRDADGPQRVRGRHGVGHDGRDSRPRAGLGGCPRRRLPRPFAGCCDAAWRRIRSAAFAISAMHSSSSTTTRRRRCLASKPAWREAAALIAAAGVCARCTRRCGYALFRAPAPPRVARFHVLPQQEGASISAVTLSADGRRLAFVGVDADRQRRLWVRPLIRSRHECSRELKAPAHRSGRRTDASSASSRWESSRKVASGGGAPQVLCDAETGFGRHLEPGGDHSLRTVPPTAACFRCRQMVEPRPPVTTRREGQAGHRFPQFLPDGRRFLFLAQAGQHARAVSTWGRSIPGNRPSP